MRLKPDYSSQPSYNIQHLDSCKICHSPEYNQALRIVQRSGLNASHWGFLIHDIASHLMGDGPYVLTGDFYPDDAEGD